VASFVAIQTAACVFEGNAMSDLVNMRGESLSAARRPPSASCVVRAASERLLGELDLPLLVSSFEGVGGNLHEAYLGTAAFHELQLLVQRAGYSLTRMGDRAAAALDAFRFTASKALDELECVHSLLVDGLEDVALSTLRAANQSSVALARDARQLADEFETAAEDVQKTLGFTLERRAGQEKRRKELASQVDEYRILLTQAENSREVTKECYEEADRLYKEAVRKEDVAHMKTTAVHVAQVATVVGSIVSTRGSLHVLGLGGVTAFSTIVEAEVMRVREEKAVHLHEKNKHRMANLDIAKEVAELTARLKLAREEDEIAEATVKSLEDAVVGLRSLSSVMLKAEFFWNHVEMHCGRSDADALESIVESSKAMTVERRSQLWVSESFKKRAVMVYCPWVALHDVCEQYSMRMTSTRVSLYSMLEHPDKERIPSENAIPAVGSSSKVDEK
jgi:hypothetical protein